MNHPLTDETLEAIHEDYVSLKIEFDQALRAAADWQLEQVKEEVKRELMIWRKSGYIAGADAAEDFFEGVMQTMRPQENN